MGKTDTSINSTHYYRDKIYLSFASHEGCLTFHNYYEGYIVRNQASRKHNKGAVEYFKKSSHS